MITQTSPLPPPPEPHVEQRGAARSIGSFLRGEPIQLVCGRCGSPWLFEFTKNVLMTENAKTNPTCPDCSHKDAVAVSAEIAAKVHVRRPNDGSWFRQHCPSEFQITNPERLLKLGRILQWRYGKQGLLLYSPTGKGKTRCLWELLKREDKAGRTIRVLTHGSSFEFAALYTEPHGPQAVL